MFAVQFDADIHNRTIVIPEKDAVNLPQKVRVILLADSAIKKSERVLFDAIKVNTSGLRFSREEMNER